MRLIRCLVASALVLVGALVGARERSRCPRSRALDPTVRAPDPERRHELRHAEHHLQGEADDGTGLDFINGVLNVGPSVAAP